MTKIVEHGDGIDDRRGCRGIHEVERKDVADLQGKELEHDAEQTASFDLRLCVLLSRE